ncbi:hypothetical protein [Tenuifilum thalassicum]|uniref:Uncharacterized protein n=1 Tax=Tenuifilum thalassicum TaxID=2590900 RepID=A0A7D4CHX5_9BACT|nr:hypothetical protein [Tenuifilum thalassicum]QKG80886.1 hypothetical protein FHG85_11640 [Tenuifilum thalassicum]
MDYTTTPALADKYTTLIKTQWDLIHDPQTILFAWAQDEEEGAIIDLSIMFDSDDLKKYNAIIKDLKQLSLFNVLYGQLDKSEKHIAISSFKANLNNLAELKKHHPYSNGYFLRAEKKEAFWGLIEYKPGDEDNPHKIVLFSSKNYELTGGKVKGDGFKSASTIFEEFFHASHFLYLEENGGFINDLKFHTQTETEVELAKAFAYYLMTIDKSSKFVNVNTPYFDTYGIVTVRKGNTAELNPEITKIFDIIIKNKEFTVNGLYALKEAIKSAFALKKQSPSYAEMDIALLNWDFAFFKFLIKEAYK